ncbi:MAG TPA: hypothetical protein H9925_11420 [Candidatus Phocaeicola gallinarum]|nr:hypothetical protein [Candidatus Phocaeicola gallinarum]
MKKNILFFNMLCALLCISCQDDALEDIIAKNETNQMVKTRSGNSWDTCTHGILRSGKKVRFPWSDSSTTAIPDDVRTDITEEYGWRILYTSIEFDGCDVNVTETDAGTNYLLLYNIYTGILKGFVYEERKVGNNNHAYWVLSTDRKTTLFNFSTKFAKPMDSPDSPQEIVLSMVSKNGVTKGFETGWNCFITELAYDPNSINEKMSIFGYSLNKASITFKGAYQSTSSGTIVTAAQGQSSIINGIATSVGQSAKNWIKEKATGDNPIIEIGSAALQAITEKGISGIINTGLYKIFGSLLGRSRTNYDLNFTTDGSITIEGESTTPSSGLITPISGIPLNGLNHSLGVWNLATAPVSTLDAYAPLQKNQAGPGRMEFYYKVKHTLSADIQINPIVQKQYYPHPSISLIQYLKGNENEVNYTQPKGTNKIAFRDNSYKDVIYNDETVRIAPSENIYNVLIANVLPNRTVDASTPGAPSVPAIALRDGNYYINDRLACKIMLHFYCKDEVYNVKTFIPIYKYNSTQSTRHYAWTQEELNRLGY